MRTPSLTLTLLGFSFLMGSLMSPITSLAQQDSPYKSFDIYFYPEYDHPGVGVYIEAEVKPGQFPRYLEIDVPEEISVAIIRKPSQAETGGERVEVQRREGRIYLPVDVSESQFQIQYYFNPFKGEETVRSMNYEFATNELLPEFHVIMQRPLAAQGFQHSFDDPEELPGDFGLVFFRQHIPGLTAGAKYPIRLSYENPTGSLTMSLLQQRMEQAQAEATEHPETPDNPSNLTVTLIVVAGLMVLLFIVVKLWGSKKVVPGADKPAKDSIANRGTKQKSPETAEAGFCSDCGSSLRAGAKFCPACGKEL